MKKKRLRSGFTTGACAAAAAKAACSLLLSGEKANNVRIPFPDGRYFNFAVHDSSLIKEENTATASVIKDAGDDPDVTNGAEIIASVRFSDQKADSNFSDADLPLITLEAGSGVGTVTKPGLAVEVGRPAINPIPRKMICEAVREAFLKQKSSDTGISFTGRHLIVTIAIKDGAELAKKTLNHRLGIIGGLSILGTTGIVKPVSAEAWTATINASMSVAIKTGCAEIVLSTGRTSEKGVQNILALPIEAYAMMGDYLEFSLKAAKDHGFEKIHLAAMWAKILKAAMRIPQTHVRHGALDPEAAARFISFLAKEPELLPFLSEANTAREIYERLSSSGRAEVIELVCRAARDFAEEITGLKVSVYLINSSGKVVQNL